MRWSNKFREERGERKGEREVERAKGLQALEGKGNCGSSL